MAGACARWTDAEDAVLRNNAGGWPLGDARWARALPGRTDDAIRRRMQRMGLSGATRSLPWSVGDLAKVYLNYHLHPKTWHGWGSLLDVPRAAASIQFAACRLGALRGVPPALSTAEVAECARLAERAARKSGRSKTECLAVAIRLATRRKLMAGNGDAAEMPARSHESRAAGRERVVSSK